MEILKQFQNDIEETKWTLNMWENMIYFFYKMLRGCFCQNMQKHCLTNSCSTTWVLKLLLFQEFKVSVILLSSNHKKYKIYIPQSTFCFHFEHFKTNLIQLHYTGGKLNFVILRHDDRWWQLHIVWLFLIWNT